MTRAVPAPRLVRPPRDAGLSDLESAVYRTAVLIGRLDPISLPRRLRATAPECAAACDTLVRLRLLTQDDDGLLSPVHPDVAATLLNGPLHDEIRERERAVENNNRVLSAISASLASAAHDNADGVRVLGNTADIRRELDAALLRCTEEIAAAHPGGPRCPDHFGTTLVENSSLHQRGVRCHLLYQHTARGNLGLLPKARALATHGGAIRTTSAGFDRMIIFDRRTLFIPTDPTATPGSGGALVVTQRSLVDFLYRTFEHLWMSALPLREQTSTPVVSADVKHAILRLMASGLKDEAIASRLGMAIRTCRRHISAIITELDVTSRFQAGIRVAQLGLLEDTHPTRTDAHPLW